MVLACRVRNCMAVGKQEGKLFSTYLLNFRPCICTTNIWYVYICFYTQRRSLERGYPKMATVTSSMEGGLGAGGPWKGNLVLDLLWFNFSLTMCIYYLFIKITKCVSPCSFHCCLLAPHFRSCPCHSGGHGCSLQQGTVREHGLRTTSRFSF